MDDRKYVAYYRVSTKKQGRSGLGIEAQKASVRAFTKCSDCILFEFIENESGKKNNRPLLEQAVQAATKHNATLIIAKLDRLSREVVFLFQLKERVEKNYISWVCLDIPEMNTINIGIYGTLAQHERETISKRTKAALTALKARGVVLGSPQNLTAAARANGIKTIKENAANNENNRRAAALIKAYHGKGLNWSAIAVILNVGGFKASKGGAFQAVQVQRIFSRLND